MARYQRGSGVGEGSTQVQFSLRQLAKSMGYFPLMKVDRGHQKFNGQYFTD